MNDPTSRDLVPVAHPPDAQALEEGPGVVDLVARGARVGLDAVGLVAGEVASASVRVARVVLPPVLGERRLDAVGGEVDRRRDAARRREELSREEAIAAMHAIVRQVVDIVVDQLDMDALIARIPIDRVIERVDIDEIAGRIDIQAIIDRIDIQAIIGRIDIGAIANEAVDSIDMGAIVRDSTTGLAGETVDAVRVQVMGVDLLAARVVDKALRRKQPRDLVLEGYDVTGSKTRSSKEIE